LIDLATLGWVVIPNLPIHKSAWYLTKDERETAITRMGHTRQQNWDLTVFRRVLLSWQFWLLPFIFMRKTYSAITINS
jgi:ACS family pantothenate transporter-like MFS transporter